MSDSAQRACHRTQWRQRVARAALQLNAWTTAVSPGAYTEHALETRCVRIEEIGRMLTRLLGPHGMTSTSMRRALRASTVWREWSDGTSLERGAISIDREPLRWDCAEALWWWGVQRGGPRTRAVLRVAVRHIGCGQPTDHLIDSLLHSPVAALRIAALVYLSCAASWSNSARNVACERRLKNLVRLELVGSLRSKEGAPCWRGLPAWFVGWIDATRRAVLDSCLAPDTSGSDDGELSDPALRSHPWSG